MPLAIADTDLIAIHLQQLQSGEPSAFQQLYRKYYDALLHEARLLFKGEEAMAVVQLSCIHSWMQGEAITSEQYFFVYTRTRMLRYSQLWNEQEPEIQRELQILREILSDQYATRDNSLVDMYNQLTPAEKSLIRQLFKSYFKSRPANSPVDEYQSLLQYGFYGLHYILC